MLDGDLWVEPMSAQYSGMRDREGELCLVLSEGWVNLRFIELDDFDSLVREIFGEDNTINIVSIRELEGSCYSQVEP